MEPQSPGENVLTPFYNREEGYYLIEIKLDDIRRLFNSLDPSPFMESDLDEDAVAYIVENARELPPDAAFKLVVYLPPEQLSAAAAGVEQSVRNYFDYRHLALGRELRQKLLNGRKSLAVGLTVLFVAIAGYKLVSPLAAGHFAWEVLAEGLLIGGWVAMWRPMETFLYDWWPISKSRKLYQRLRRMPVEVRPL